MRLIDADALKIAIDDRWMPDMMVSEIWGVIDEAPTVATGINVPNKWISVKDRMPSDEEVERTKFGFLCYIEGFFIMLDGFDILPYNKEAKAFWSLHNNRAIDNVTHWMPLPEIPKEVNNA